MAPAENVLFPQLENYLGHSWANSFISRQSGLRLSQDNYTYTPEVGISNFIPHY
jgi:hypothetical protein